jgi:hypothetical protein
MNDRYFVLVTDIRSGARELTLFGPYGTESDAETDVGKITEVGDPELTAVIHERYEPRAISGWIAQHSLEPGRTGSEERV